jgi:hypothetical protein
MKGLTKRVDALEQEEGIQEKQEKLVLWVEYASDGGLVHDGVWYADADALTASLGHEPDTVWMFGWQAGETAAELIAEAEERKRNPPPAVTVDDLGEQGRALVAEGVSPAVAKICETLRP